jgi:hypothetical protein
MLPIWVTPTIIDDGLVKKQKINNLETKFSTKTPHTKQT